VFSWLRRKKTDQPREEDLRGDLLRCASCGQTYNPRYMQYCARCGEAVPDERGKLPRPGPMDGMGARGGAPAGLAPVERSGADIAAEEAAEHADWRPSQAVDDMVLEYRNRLNEAPEDHSARFALALAYVFAQRWEQAARELELVIQALPEYADARYRLALCRAQLGQRDAAVEAARAAIRLEPGQKRYQRLLQSLEHEPRDDT